MVAYAEQEIEKLISNPISTSIIEERILKGYKTQFKSINGLYDVIDLDITDGNGKRQVNINTIKWLIFDDVKYIVE